MRCYHSFKPLHESLVSYKVSRGHTLRHVRHATTAMRMPAMSPTMTEGGIASWKMKDGDTFVVGDVLLEIETDKATIDVEAQDDGVMGKIIAEVGSSKIPVGQIIAILAEEGDDLSSITVPAELGPEDPSSSQPKPEEKPKAKQEKASPAIGTSEKKPESKAEGSKRGKEQEKAAGAHKELRHSRPLFPSVARLLLESPLSTEEISKLKGTGKNGMLTKGDVLLALGRIKSAFGSAENMTLDIMGPSGRRASESAKSAASEERKPVKTEIPLDGPGLRRLILEGMSRATEPPKPIVQQRGSFRTGGLNQSQGSSVPSPLPRSSDTEFDALLAPYASLLPAPKPDVTIPSAEMLAEMEGRGSRGNRDEWAGLF
ncbi:MAG: hypothetical protein TREMPRED_004535 [Tremellales sp. Tagirdzhanova-0007]|nr:MAG: hypothetical protein TREMPRED_004535 [Tremellales sp. Tagirdzhanova-0007]